MADVRRLGLGGVIGLAALCAGARAAAADDGLCDQLRFGDPAAETAHALAATDSQPVPAAGLGQPARRLLPLSPPQFEGGRMAFTMRVDPRQPNYLTVKLWGSDVSTDHLILFVDGKQVGYHHLGDVDQLDFGDEGEPGFLGRFFYNTSPLPPAVTRGKRELRCEIRCIGPIWGYGTTFAQYQKPLTEPTRGIYAVYTHTDGCFVPPATEPQGRLPDPPPVRRTPGVEVLEAAKDRVNREIDAELRSSNPLGEMQCQFLARAYGVHWCHAYRNRAVVEQVTRGLDALYAAWRADPTLAEHDRTTPNPGWFEFGPAGEAVSLLAEPLRAALDRPLADGTPRRSAWSQLLRAGRDYHVHHRRLYTNQSMITDLNICWSDRGVAVLDPAQALPAGRVLHYLYQSVGLEPWLGSETDHGPDRPMGDHYFELTDHGLTKELGYVGYYGEVLDWTSSLYDATRPTPQAPGDARLRDQLVKIIKARCTFRYPAVDADGNRAMRIEATVGWRDEHHPGGVAYVERPSWDASALRAPAAVLDPTVTGYVQQMFDDNQFFATLAGQMRTANLRVTAGLLAVADDYATLRAQPPSPARLPMTPGRPDFAWADEQDGVLAVKHGDDVFYASLYWRARTAVNFLARVHDVRPAFERIAVVREAAEFEPSGQTYTVPDWIDMDFGRGGYAYPGGPHSALAGERRPIAKLPPDDRAQPGDEDPNAGRASFYTLRYGDYLIGMNTTAGRTFTLAVPAGLTAATDLVSSRPLDLTRPVTVGPRSTVVLDLAGARRAATPDRATPPE